MLKKSSRLTTKQFDAVLKEGRTAHSPLFLLRWIPGQSSVQISAVAPAKVFKSAVLRNRMRRRMYEAVRTTLHSNEAGAGGPKDHPAIENGAHAILFAKSGANEADLNALITDIRSLFVKARILR